MARQVFEYESQIAAPAQVVFSFHERADALQLLIPPGQPIQILEHTGGIRNGAKVVLRMGHWPFSIDWVARHQGYVEGRQFQDVQERGPFTAWLHTHTVVPLSETSCILRDHIEYEFRLGLIFDRFIRHQLKNTFAYRHQITARETTQL